MAQQERDVLWLDVPFRSLTYTHTRIIYCMHVRTSPKVEGTLYS